MWSKAKLFRDEHSAEAILKVGAPKQGIYIGRRIINYDDQVWEENKENILTAILLEKFSQNKRLRKWLLSTKDAILAEIALESASGEKDEFDTELGISLGISDDEIYKPHLWKNYGNNLLGNILMKVRNMLVAN